MKKTIILIVSLMFVLCSCGAGESAETGEGGASEGGYPTFTFTHYSTGATTEEYEAVILFEQSNSTFTSYQVAFSSCTCRDSSVNYLSVAYVELLNNKDSMFRRMAQSDIEHGADTKRRPLG